MKTFTCSGMWTLVFAVGCGGGGGGGVPPAAAPDAAPPTAAADAQPAGRDFSSSDGPVAPSPDKSEATAPIADPAQPGPWAVGVRTVTLSDPSRKRTFATEIWYPVSPAAPDGTPNHYALQVLFLTVLDVKTPARRDATPAAGPWPLVLFSHGFGGIRFQSYFLCEHLASHGFVVAASDHPGNTLNDMLQLGSDDAALQSSVDRPLDVIFTAERLLDGKAGLPTSIIPTQLAVSGHSFGGWTALEVARRDARFGAVLSLAPGFRKGSTPDFVAQLARPLAIFGGSVDKTTPFTANQLAAYDKAQPPKYLFEVMGAGHLDFSDLCQVPIATMLVKDGCNPSNIDPNQVHQRVRTLGTAFLQRHLRGDARYDSFLTTSYVNALGKLQYWRAP